MILRKTLSTFFLLGAACLLCMPANTAKAHSLFIQAARYHVSKGKVSPLYFCYGHHFPVDDALRREKLHSVQIQSPDKSVAPVKLRDGKSLHSYMVDYEQPGTYVLSAETTPGYFTRWIDKKGRKRHSIKPMQVIADKAASVEASIYSKQWTKTYVTCDKPSTPFPGCIGMPLELVPTRDPSTYKKGEVAEFKIYRYGKPYTGVGYWDATYNGYSTEAEDMYVQRTEVKDGLIKLPLDTTGRWFVRFFIKTPAPESKHSEYLTSKLTSTLVFEIPNARRKPKVDGH